MESYINQVDFFKGNDPEKIAQEYGTPLYVYNEEIIRKHMDAVAKVITKYPYTANYSVKANTNIHILKLALEEGNNCDAMSIGEIRMLQKAGFPTDRIFYVPNNVSEEELKETISIGVMTSLDSLAQLELYGSLNPGGKCAVRLNPGVGAGHHEKVVTAGKKTKFGIAEEDIDQIFEIAARYQLTIAGINQQHGKGIGQRFFLRIAQKRPTGFPPLFVKHHRGAVAFFGEFHKDALDPLRIAVHCTRKRQLRHTGRSRCSSAREFAKQRKPCEEIVSELI